MALVALNPYLLCVYKSTNLISKKNSMHRDQRPFEHGKLHDLMPLLSHVDYDGRRLGVWDTNIT